MTTEELTDLAMERLDKLQAVHDSPNAYLDSVVDGLGERIAHLGPAGRAWMVGFIAGQIVAEDALTTLAQELPDTVPEEWSDDPEQKGDVNDGS